MTSKEVNISDILRTADVYRWHSVKTLRKQSNAEHMYLVTMLGNKLATRVYPEISLEEKFTLSQWLLIHDVPESMTGDIATPVKRYLESFFPVGQNPLDDLEGLICPEYKSWKDKVTNTPLRRIAKLADLIEMWVFLKEEGIDQYAAKIQLNIYNGITDMVTESQKKYPELNWMEAINFCGEIKECEGTHIEFEWHHEEM